MKKFTFLLALVLTFNLLPAYAYKPGPVIAECINPTSTAQQNEQTAVDMLYWLHQALSENRMITQAETEHFFAKDAVYITNDKQQSMSADHYIKSVNNLAKHIAKVSDKIREVIATEEHVTVWYDTTITLKNGIKTPTVVMSLFTFKNHKINRWVKVVDSHVSF